MANMAERLLLLDQILDEVAAGGLFQIIPHAQVPVLMSGGGGLSDSRIPHHPESSDVASGRFLRLFLKFDSIQDEGGLDLLPAPRPCRTSDATPGKLPSHGESSVIPCTRGRTNTDAVSGTRSLGCGTPN